MADAASLPIRIFVSSPGDVVQERVVAQRVIERLQDEFVQRAAIDPVFWELEPCLATGSFQPQIPRAAHTDICVILFWSRLGTPLTVDGITYGSGTEYEFRDASAAFKEKGTPSVLVYRKTEQRFISTREHSELTRIIQQQKSVDEFVRTWIRAEDGNLRAFHEFETLAQLEERLEEHLRKLIERKLVHSGRNVQARPRWNKGSPFRGLAPFDEAHKDIFFGRTAAIHEVLNALRRQAADGRSFLLVTGMSGSGKSSLVRAGVLPIISRPGVIEGIGAWRHSVLRPSRSSVSGGGLLDALASALVRSEALPALRSSADLPSLLGSNPEAIVPLLRRELSDIAAALTRENDGVEELQARLLLVVDQLEELFVDERVAAASRAALGSVLALLARSGLVWVIATLRSDFYGRLAELPELMALKEGAGHYDLRAPTLGEIGLMIRKPAQMANLRFDVRPSTGEPLDDVLCAEAARDPGALPLLQFTLEALYERRTSDGVLTFAAYEELGGLEGALARRAEQVFASLSASAQQALPRVLAALVRLGGEKDEELAQRPVPIERVTANLEMRALVTAFTDQRLFTTDRADDGTAVLGVAHEALLRRWPRIQQWVEQNRHLLRARSNIAAAMALWMAEERSAEFLLRGGRSLEDGRALMSAYGEALTPDEQAFIRASLAADSQRRKRRILARIGAAAAGLLLCAGGFSYYFFKARDTVSYYSDATIRWGLPEGLGQELSADEVARRHVSLKFTRRGSSGPVVRVEVVNGQGNCPARHGVSNFLNLDLRIHSVARQDGTSRDDGAGDPAANINSRNVEVCSWEFQSEGGRAKEEHAFDRGRRRLYTLTYVGDIAQYSSSKGYALPLLGSGVSHLHTQWWQDGPNQGRPRIIQFRNAQGSPRPDHAGKYGLAIDHNENGLPVRITNIGKDGNRVRTNDGYAVVTIGYDKQNNPVDVAFLDEFHRPTRTTDNISGYHSTYDQDGNLARQSYFDLRGKPTANTQKVWAVDLVYDEARSLSTIRYLDGNHARTRDKNGISSEKMLYGKDGAEAELVFLDEADRRIRHKEVGAAGIRFQHNDAGKVSEEIYVDEAGQPTRNTSGYASAAFTYDSDFNITQIEFRDELGNKTRTKDGYAALAREYDDIGQIVRETYLDESDALAPVRLREAGYAGVRRTYDDRGNCNSETYLDEKGEKARHRKGYAEVRRSYDSDGRVAEEKFYDESGKLVGSDDGYAVAKFTRNQQGQTITEEYFNEQGTPAALDSGWVKITQDYNDRGLEIQSDSFDRDGLIGWRVQSQYGSNDEPTQKSFWRERIAGQGPQKTSNSEGCHGYRSEYDASGNPTVVDCLGQQSPLAMVRGKYHRKKMEYDAWGNIEARYYFTVKEEKNNPTTVGHAGELYSYDSRGQLTEVAYVDQNRFRTDMRLGYASIQFAYDERGNRIRESYYDKGGGPAYDLSTRVSATVRKYDRLSRETERVNYGALGQLVRNASGFALMARAYDEAGRVSRIDFFDEIHQPVAISGTFSSVIYEYDVRGTVRSMRYLDEVGRGVTLRRELLPKSTHESEYQEIREIHEYAAKLGYTTAQNLLGWTYETGRVVPVDPELAKKWYGRAAALGDAYGMSNLGMLILKEAAEGPEEVQPRRESEGVRLVRRAAESGNPAGQTNLGLLYFQRRIPLGGSSEDYDREATVWFRRAADQNNWLGQSHLGAMYELGRGVPPDLQEAERYYRLSAENGESEGMANLGLLYLKKGKRDEGAEWIRKAALLGHASAQANLGFLYAKGTGVREDTFEAFRWYALALANPQIEKDIKDKARRNLDALQGQWLPLTKKMIAQWKSEAHCSAQYLEPLLGSAKNNPNGCDILEKDLDAEWKRQDAEKDATERERIRRERVQLIKLMAADIAARSER